tara:strand:+ start:367 stop:600 length:234 start_codon:yes stop_codon:yes gene_type:complete
MPWSKEIEHLTLQVCREKSFSGGNPDGVIFKHFDGDFGVVSYQNALKDRWFLTIHKSGDQIDFSSVDELVLSGWVLD